MKIQEMKKNNKGFSLVELIIVIAIMAVLMAVLAPQLLRYVERSRYQKDMSAVGELENAMKIATSNENAIVGTTFPVTCTISHTDGTATWSAPAGGAVAAAFTNEIQTTIMGAPTTTVDLNFTSTTLTGATGTDITIVITNAGITTVTNTNTAP